VTRRLTRLVAIERRVALNTARRTVAACPAHTEFIADVEANQALADDRLKLRNPLRGAAQGDREGVLFAGELGNGHAIIESDRAGTLFECAADLAGEFDMMLLARFRDTDHLRAFLQGDLRRVTRIAGVRTLLVLDETPQRSLLLPRAKS